MSPLQRLMKDGVPDNLIERARLRDNLYALLATAPDEAAAKKIIQALQQVWLTSGSDTIDLLMIRALKSQKAKKDAIALQLLDSVVDLAPDYAEGWNRRAYVYYKRRDYRAAAGDLRRTLALDSKHYRALSGLGTILSESGDDAGALKVYERLLDINPNDKDAVSSLDELKRKVEGRGI
jgi:tetratricopeptide (TPR) repeat protein